MGISDIAVKWPQFNSDYSCEADEAENYWSTVASGEGIKGAVESIPKRLSTSSHKWLYLTGDGTRKSQGLGGLYFLSGLKDDEGNQYHLSLEPYSDKNDSLAGFHLTCDTKSGRINAETGKKKDAGYAKHEQNWHLYFEVTQASTYKITVRDFHKVRGVHNSDQCSDYRMADLIVPTIMIADTFLNPDS
jgi:hypothetical protein